MSAVYHEFPNYLNSIKVSPATDITVLLSARDVGAAGHIFEAVQALRAVSLKCIIALQGPAATYFEMRSKRHEQILVVRNANSSFAESLMRRIQPRLLVCGNSGQASLGIDEWLIHAARKQGIPSICLQDFWGDVRADRAFQADHYAVLDVIALKMTRQITDKAIHVIGSIKHSGYKNINPAKLRQKFRHQLAIKDTTSVVTFFGQNLISLPSYTEIISDVADIVSKHTGATLCYRPHPLETPSSIKITRELLRASRSPYIVSPNVSAEEVICGSDAILSSFSTIGLDAVHIPRAGYDLSTPIIYIEYPSELRRLWQGSDIDTHFPLVQTGQAHCVRNRKALALCLSAILCGNLRAPNTITIPQPINPIQGFLRLVFQVI